MQIQIQIQVQMQMQLQMMLLQMKIHTQIEGWGGESNREIVSFRASVRAVWLLGGI